MSDLRTLLGGQPQLEFALELPTGWTRETPDEATEKRKLQGLRTRLMHMQRPELYAQLKSAVEQSFVDMRSAGVVAMFSATEHSDETVFLPTSMTAAYRTSEPDLPLTEIVRDLIVNHDGAPLFGDKSVVRAEREDTVTSGDESIINHSVIYLMPVPGTRRSKALQLVAGFARPASIPADAPSLELIRVMLDTCVSTLRWLPPKAS